MLAFSIDEIDPCLWKCFCIFWINIQLIFFSGHRWIHQHQVLLPGLLHVARPQVREVPQPHRGCQRLVEGARNLHQRVLEKIWKSCSTWRREKEIGRVSCRCSCSTKSGAACTGSSQAARTAWATKTAWTATATTATVNSPVVKKYLQKNCF